MLVIEVPTFFLFFEYKLFTKPSNRYFIRNSYNFFFFYDHFRINKISNKLVEAIYIFFLSKIHIFIKL